MFLNFNNILDFTRGVAYGANVAKTGSMVNCLNNLNNVAGGGQAALNYFLSNATLYGALITIDKALSVVYSASSLSSDCVNGAFQAQTNVMKYITFTTDPMLLVWNLVYNFGLLYQSVKSVLFFFVLTDRNTINNTNDLGK